MPLTGLCGEHAAVMAMPCASLGALGPGFQCRYPTPRGTVAARGHRLQRSERCRVLLRHWPPAYAEGQLLLHIWDQESALQC